MDCFSGSGIYFPIGLEHILDVQGYDHILFVMALAVMYEPKDWKKILVLVTAFTIGHSLTLALSVLDIFTLPSDLVEFFIPCTIFLTGVLNIVEARRKTPATSSSTINYLVTLLFGFIHGLGFSNYLKALLGKEACIAGPLLTFNLGLEAGQLVIVGIMMLLTLLFVRTLKLPHPSWKILISLIVSGVAIYLMTETYPF